MRRARVIGLNLHADIRGIVREFMPIAGDRLTGRAKAKIGTYQTGWALLAKSTRRKKARNKSSRRRSILGSAVFSADTPLLEHGRMRGQIRHKERDTTTTVEGPWLVALHEQDPEVGEFNLPYSWRNAIAGEASTIRPLLGPTLEESLEPLARDLEAFVAMKF